MKPRFLLWMVVMIFMTCPGCQALKRVIIRPPREGVTQESAAVRAHVYKSEVIINAPPKEVMDYFVKDITWLNKAMGILKKLGVEAELPEMAPGKDMSQVGQTVGFTVKVLGIKFPCQSVTCKYVSEKEMWLLIHSNTSWMLCRFNLSPHAKGTALALNVTIVPSGTMGTLIDTFQLSKAIAGMIDLMIGIIQGEFDPNLDLKELTQRGLRGEIYEGLLQSYQAQTMIDAPLEKVQDWMNQPESILQILKEFNVEKDLVAEFKQVPPDTFFYAPGVFESGIFKVKVDILAIKIPRDQGYIFRGYLIALNQFGLMEFELNPEVSGGTLASGRVLGDIPVVGSAENMDLILFETGIPKIIQEKILTIKNAFE